MAAPDLVHAFMAKNKSLGGVIVQEPPKLDLDLYIQNYIGRTRIDRLLLIGTSSVHLCLDALRAAVIEAKEGKDVSLYRAALEHLRSVAPNDPEAQTDDAWIERTELENKTETARLENELKGYKNNLIKESIRMGNEDLGKHLESIGKLMEASEAYSKMRQDVGTTKHVVDCGMHIANVSLHRRDFTMVLSNIGKMTAVEDDDARLQAYARIASGIALLGLQRYDEAANSFLRADPRIFPREYNHIATPNDVAVYGGLLALATMDRRELQERVLNYQSFRTFLEQEPHIRKAISLFVNGRYSNCLSILEASRADYLLDIHLQAHISTIYSKIRSKCIIQYFLPFSCVTITSLDAAFARPGTQIEPELLDMIRDGALKARIDAKHHLLLAVRPDARAALHKEALRMAHDCEREAKERLRRMSLVAAGLDVVAGKKSATGTSASSGVDKTWFEETMGTSQPAVIET